MFVAASTPNLPSARAAGFTRNLLIATAAIVAVAASAMNDAKAQAEWPTRNVSVIVPFAAGGNTDIMARIASQKLSETFKQTFVVENRAGAGGAIAANYVLQQPADGYTLFFAAAPQINVLPNVQKVNFDPIKDFTPVSVFGTGPFILAIRSDIPSKTVKEFIDYAKQRKMNYGSGGTGSVSHLSGALFVARAGLDSVHIPFKGGAPAMSALLGGQVDMYFGNAADIIPHVETGKARILAVAADKRIQQLPDVPIVSETFPNFSINAWNGFLVKAGTPKPLVDRIAQAVIAATKDPVVIQQLSKLGIEPNGTTSEEMAAQIKREQPQFDAAIKAGAMKQE